MLELRNISFQAENENDGKEIEILRNINLTIEDQFVAVTGPNGSGKSTLAKIVAGMLVPTEGQIFLDGVDITEKSITERAKLGIGFAFQQPVRFKGITVRDLLSIAAGKDTDMAEICSMLSEVGLCARDYVNREINASLSGGELKRIEIAMIMARKSRLAIFDEPEAGIDLWSFQSLIRVFEKMHEEIRGTILIISHQERILNIADQIVLLSDGRIEKVGSREEIMPQLLGAGQPCRTLADKL
ncbi:MAG: ATP-binding cassette domain-containing protein [Lachnospiraceae bacterium]|nr:ATP-binding cassette domain-containing protein [Lachnospiraceae bacterium]